MAPRNLYPPWGVPGLPAGYFLLVPGDLGSGILFVVLFLAALGGLLFLLAWLEPPHDTGSVPRQMHMPHGTS
jgi:hypothetical protein